MVAALVGLLGGCVVVGARVNFEVRDEQGVLSAQEVGRLHLHLELLLLALLAVRVCDLDRLRELLRLRPLRHFTNQ